MGRKKKKAVAVLCNCEVAVLYRELMRLTFCSFEFAELEVRMGVKER